MNKLGTMALGLALTMVALTAIACSKGNSTPTKAFKTYYNSLKNKDVKGLKTIMKKKDLEEIEAEAKKKNKSLDDFIKDEVIEQVSRKIPAEMPETRNEKIDGDNATLEVKDGDNWRPAKFVKEDDGWKIDM